MDKLEVNCYSGYTYAERPTSFRWQGLEYEVEEIEKEWLEPGEKYFRVRSGDNKFFQLCYNDTNQKWSVKEILNPKP